MRLVYVVMLVLFVTYLVAQPAGKSADKKTDPRILPASQIDQSIDYSNILPGDYTGPETCAECHEEYYERWQTHSHSRMNQLPSESTVMGDFDNAVLKLPAGEVRFTKSDDGKYLVTTYKDNQQIRRYLVTRTVGSRHMQAYIGKQIEGPEVPEHPIWAEHDLPFGYWFYLDRWVPRDYMTVSSSECLNGSGQPRVKGIDATPQVRPYTTNCMNCHNTYPYAFRMFHDQIKGFPESTVSAEVQQLSAAITQSSEDLTVNPTVKSVMLVNKNMDPDKHLVTFGISCESCHFGGREHAIREREIKFLPTSRLTRISASSALRLPTGDRSNALTTRGICTQCHSANEDLFPTGASKGISREGRDLQDAACASQLSCIDCHDPHQASPNKEFGVDLAEHVNVCADCHTEYQDQQFAVDHTGHEAGSTNCLDCHMPKYVRGINEVARTHRICLPLEESMVAEGKANACNSCHVDKSVRWTLQAHNRIWGTAFNPTSRWTSIDSLDKPSADAWLADEDRHMRYLAFQWIAISPFAKQKIGDVADMLNDPEPSNRVFAWFSINRILGRAPGDSIPVDITQGPEVRQRQIGQWMKKLDGEQQLSN